MKLSLYPYLLGLIFSAMIGVSTWSQEKIPTISINVTDGVIEPVFGSST